MAKTDDFPLKYLGENKAVFSEKNIPPMQHEYSTDDAFAQIRASDTIPVVLVDLVEGFREQTPVTISVLRRQDTYQIDIKINDPKQSLDTLTRGKKAALRRKAKEAGLNWFTASEALALCLRLLLRKHKAPRRPSPARKHNIVARSVISEVAVHLLNLCVLWGYAPGPMLRDLVRELLNVESRRASVPRRAEARWNAVQILAEQPAMASREVARMVGVDASTIVRWRRNSDFKAEIERCKFARRFGSAC